ncbi:MULTISPECIES: hypothetical protein [unclassified Microcoleus]|uniref:hypothetical protein n=1 Tax=unclassified Microcoleus TaxID=2642155 RepID=UPI002FD3DCF8
MKAPKRAGFWELKRDRPNHLIVDRTRGFMRGWPETGFFTKIIRCYQEIRPKTRFLELGA